MCWVPSVVGIILRVFASVLDAETEDIMITKDMTIGEAIKQNPDIIQVLSDEGIDYCCGGGRPLVSAAKEKKLDIDSFVILLNKQKHREHSSMEEALKLGKNDLIDYIIRTHHVAELKWLDEIDALMQKITNVHYVHHGKELAEIYKVFLEVKADMVPHFAKEEKQDFPEFKAGKAVNFDELREEHEAVGELLEKLEKMTNHFQAPQDGCASYKRTFELMDEFQADVHRHIFLENSVLFQM